jgi:AcrR family transcriptional regulator
VSTAAAGRPVGRPRSERVDAAVLKAATDLLADQGFAALSIEAVALRSGIAKSSIYRRWASKDELVYDALAAVKGPLPVPPGVGVADDLHYLAQTMREQWTDGLHGRLMRRLSVDGSDDPTHYRQFRERLIAPRQEIIRTVLRRGVQEGLIDPTLDLEWVLALFTAPMIASGLTHRSLSAADIDQHVEILLRGLAPH